MTMVARTPNRPTAQPLDAPRELERLAAALRADLDGGSDRRVDVHLARLRRAVDAAAGRTSLGRGWHAPWPADHAPVIAALLGRRRLRLGFDADAGWILAATDRPDPRGARA